MKKEVIYSLSGLYRDDLRITGYKFGSGEKTLCVIGAIRGDEVQQLYMCGKLVQRLKALEESGKLAENKEIMVIPTLNSYSMNTGRRFWCLDNTDINRVFPGSEDGETTERVAAAVFDVTKEFRCCVQFPSFYIPGDFVPHVRIMRSGDENIELAKNFKMKYIVLREPTALDKSTLNYSVQSWGSTAAYSVYARTRETIDERSAEEGVEAVLRYLANEGTLEYKSPEEYDSEIVEESRMVNIKNTTAGIFKRYKEAGDEVKAGDLLAKIIHPYEGEEVGEIISPEDGTIFFAHKRPLISEYTLAFKIVK